MKKAQLLALGLLLALTVAGCGAGKEEESGRTGVVFEKVEAPVAAPVQEAPVEEEPEEEEDPDVPPREGMVRDFFSNEWVEGDQNIKRPLAVMYPINKEAQPQYGLDKVRVFYEIMEEGTMSRQMGILEEWEDLNKIGNLRSIRDYFVYAALEYDPIIIHYGGPEVYVKDILTRSDVDNLNGVGGVMGPDGGAFFRDPPGSTSEHTAYTDGARVAKGMEKLGFQTNHKEEYSGVPHFTFAPVKEPNTLEQYGSETMSAEKIDMTGCYPVTKSALSYHADDGLYYKTLYGNPQVDAVSGEQLTFANIIVQGTYWEKRDTNGYLAFRMHDTTHDGYYITGGKMIHITWKKTADYEPTKYYDDNGEEIELNTGRTMIFVARDSDTFTADGTEYTFKSEKH